MSHILRKLFGVYNEYEGFQKIKIFSFFFIPFKFRYYKKTTLDAMRPKKYPDLKIISENRDLISRKCFASICAIYKNEADLREWIEYHKLVGFERFYLYDNESTDGSKEMLEPYIKDGTVVYHYIQGNSKQFAVYNDALARYKNDTKWMAFVDIDEYICPVQTNNIKDFLKDFKKEPAVGINWVMFDSNGHKKRPNLLVIEAYTRVRANYQHPFNKHIKSIVQPTKVLGIKNPHYCFYYGNKTAVDEKHCSIGSPSNIHNCNNAFTENNSIEKIRINHYHTKSEEDYIAKIKRGYSDRTGEQRPSVEYSEINFNEETTEDRVILKYLPELKQKLGVL